MTSFKRSWARDYRINYTTLNNILQEEEEGEGEGEDEQPRPKPWIVDPPPIHWIEHVIPSAGRPGCGLVPVGPHSGLDPRIVVAAVIDWQATFQVPL